MSEINISIGGMDAGTTIDTERMRDRLEFLRDRLQKAIDQGIGNPDALQDRINKVDSQLTRLDRLDGQNLEISAERAAFELERGLKQIEDGRQFIDRNYGSINGARGLDDLLQSWQESLFDMQGRLNTFG